MSSGIVKFLQSIPLIRLSPSRKIKKLQQKLPSIIYPTDIPVKPDQFVPKPLTITLALDKRKEAIQNAKREAAEGSTTLLRSKKMSREDNEFNPQLRQARLAEQVRQCLLPILAANSFIPLRSCRINSVTVSKDYKHCHVYWTSNVESEASSTQIEFALNKSLSSLRYSVQQHLNLKNALQMHFIQDHSLKIEEINNFINT